MNKESLHRAGMLETGLPFRQVGADDEFVDDSGDRRVATSSPRSLSDADRYCGDELPKNWFSWRKYVPRGKIFKGVVCTGGLGTQLPSTVENCVLIHKGLFESLEMHGEFLRIRLMIIWPARAGSGYSWDRDSL